MPIYWLYRYVSYVICIPFSVAAILTCLPDKVRFSTWPSYGLTFHYLFGS